MTTKQKRLTLEELDLAQLVVRGTHKDAQVYTIGARHKFNIFLVWFEGDQKCGQWTDYGDCYRPTIEQIQYSISVNGRLASSKDITNCLLEEGLTT
jgi:hypothetical protein